MHHFAQCQNQSDILFVPEDVVPLEVLPEEPEELDDADELDEPDDVEELVELPFEPDDFDDEPDVPEDFDEFEEELEELDFEDPEELDEDDEFEELEELLSDVLTEGELLTDEPCFNISFSSFNRLFSSSSSDADVSKRSISA